MIKRDMKLRRHQGGFTLIELMIVLAIMSILLGIAVPIYQKHLTMAHEAVLKEDLSTMRQAIDQYTYDKNKAPQSLADLVSAGYMKAIPKDPFTLSTDSWQTVQEDVNIAMDQTETGISDVHSGSEKIGSDGTVYNTW